jgi:hypothetical protein
MLSAFNSTPKKNVTLYYGRDFFTGCDTAVYTEEPFKERHSGIAY